MNDANNETKFCPKCYKLFALTADNDPFFPVHKTTDLNICPRCKGTLRKPSSSDYIFANKVAAHEIKKEKNQWWEESMTFSSPTQKEKTIKFYFKDRKSLYSFRTGVNFMAKEFQKIEQENRELKGEIVYYQNKLKERDEEIANLKELLDMDTERKEVHKKKFRECKFCKNTYLPKRKDQKFCSDECRWNYQNEKKLSTRKASKNEKK
jgi:hypothetical protein